MNAADLIAALELPASARVDSRVPRRLLVENGAPTAADKRRINEGIEKIHWVAALKPATIGVPEYRDQAREYLEIAVLRMTVRHGARGGRLAELVHRAVPYPVLLVTTEPPHLIISLAHKRWSQGEVGKTVLDGELVSADMHDVPDAELFRPFQEALAVARQPRATLYALYEGWMNTVVALEVAGVTGAFTMATTAEHATARRVALQECARLEARIATLRAVAEKETQLSRQVELNLELKRVQAAHAAARAKL